METSQLGILLIPMLVGLVLGVLVGALILKLSVKLVEKFSLPYGRACLTVIVAFALGFAINFVIGLVIGLIAAGAGLVSASDPSGLVGLQLVSGGIGLVVGFFINAAVINWMVKRPDGSALGFGRACLVALVYLLIFVVLAAVIGGIVFAIFGTGMLAGLPTQ